MNEWFVDCFCKNYVFFFSVLDHLQLYQAKSKPFSLQWKALAAWGSVMLAVLQGRKGAVHLVALGMKPSNNQNSKIFHHCRPHLLQTM